MRLSVRQLLSGRPATHLWPRLTAACEPYLARTREALAPYWRQIAEWYDKREPRERLLVRLLCGIAAILFIYNALYEPVREWSDGLAEQVTTRQHQVVRLRGMMRNYERLRLELASTQKRTVPRGKDPALFSVLEMTLTNSVGRAKIGSITPSEHPVPGGFQQYTVDVKLNEIGLAQIVDTLYSLQSLNVPITISNFQIHQHARDSHTFDVDLSCMALGKAG
jgi:Type II secretion system (T2SS), protein M